jgi:hypothetical protein
MPACSYIYRATSKAARSTPLVNCSIFVDQTFNLLLTAFIVGFLVGVIMTVVGKIYELFVIATCLIGIITLPIFLAAVGYFSLWVVSLIFPDWIAITTGAWRKNLLLSLALGLIRYHEKPKKRKSSKAKNSSLDSIYTRNV